MGNWKKQKRIDLNPSSADRWSTCTASPKYIFDNWDRLPPENRTYSDEGNTAHEVGAALLQGRKVNPKDCPVPRNAEINLHAWEYMEFVQGLREEGGRIIVEQKLPLFYAESRNAIVDAAVINTTNLHIVDFKYGEGVIVSPIENLQATIYAKSVVWASARWNNGITLVFNDDFPVSVHIFQPRNRNAEEAPFHTWETTWGQIRKGAEWVQYVAEQILANSKGVNFEPSDKACQFCPAKTFCDARPAMLTKDLQVIHDTPDNLPDTVTEKQLVAILTHGDAIKKWIEDRKTYALQRMRAGNKIPGFKLVTSRGGNRYWSDSDKAAKYLLADTILREEEIYEEPQLVSPAQVEKLVGKKKFSARVYNLIAKAPGHPIIAPESDPRESCMVDASKEFEVIDNDGEPRKVSLDQF